MYDATVYRFAHVVTGSCGGKRVHCLKKGHPRVGVLSEVIPMEVLSYSTLFYYKYN